jgi:tRNA(fMet)-specific endonuclease VapC
VIVVVDTSVVIDLLRGREEARSLLQPPWEELIVSTITVHEVYAGMRPGEEERTAMMLAGFEVLPFGSAEARLTGRWWRDYREKGVTLDFRDLAIAAVAVMRNLPLLTGNVKDFPMAELRVEQWPPAPV